MIKHVAFTGIRGSAPSDAMCTGSLGQIVPFAKPASSRQTKPLGARAAFVERQHRKTGRARAALADRRGKRHNPFLDAPAPDIGGAVFVMEHLDGLEGYVFFSVNHCSHTGTGWQSERLYTEGDANAVAAVLAQFCRAEWVRE